MRARLHNEDRTIFAHNTFDVLWHTERLLDRRANLNDPGQHISAEGGVEHDCVAAIVHACFVRSVHGHAVVKPSAGIPLQIFTTINIVEVSVRKCTLVLTICVYKKI